MVKRKVVSLDYIQFLVTKGITLHPILQMEYYNMLLKLQQSDKICLTPHAKLELYSLKMKKRMAA